jgi:hypothetical protein
MSSLNKCRVPVFLDGAGILEQSLWARNRVRIGLSYPPVRLAEPITWNRFLGSLEVLKYRLGYGRKKRFLKLRKNQV